MEPEEQGSLSEGHGHVSCVHCLHVIDGIATLAAGVVVHCFACVPCQPAGESRFKKEKKAELERERRERDRERERGADTN